MSDEGLLRAALEDVIVWLEAEADHPRPDPRPAMRALADLCRAALAARSEPRDGDSVWTAVAKEYPDSGLTAMLSEPRAEGLPAYINTAGGQYDVVPRGEGLREAQEAIDVLLDRIDYVNGADARQVIQRVKAAMLSLADTPPAPALSEGDCAYRCPLTPEGHEAMNADHDYEAATPPAPALDVERLARVIRGMNLAPFAESDDIAATIAIRYAAVAPKRQETPPDV